MVGAYKLGWRAALLAAVASPIVNHALFGLPATDVMALMALKLSLLAVVAGLAAQYFKSVSLPALIAVVLVTKALEFLAEYVLTGSVAATVADFTIGWPGLLLQVLGTYAILRIWKS